MVSEFELEVQYTSEVRDVGSMEKLFFSDGFPLLGLSNQNLEFVVLTL